ncbi:hypothetical protein [Planctomycetes bacterium K23_9]
MSTSNQSSIDRMQIEASSVNETAAAPKLGIDCAPRYAAIAVMVLVLWAGLTGSCAVTTWAQSPGDFPSVEAIRSAANARASRADGLPVVAFKVLDKSGNLIYIPGMTYERLRELESGADSVGQAFVFEPLEITGTASNGRAELDISLEVTVEPTDQQYVSIPLHMANFFPLHAPQFTSSPSPSESDSQFVQPGDDGLVLKVRSEKRRKLKMQMSVSALVPSGPNRLDFQLPNLPTNIHLDIDEVDAAGEVIGSGSEVYSASKTKTGGTRFDVATGGGSMTLQWSPVHRGAASSALLESDSVVLLNWASPQDQPIASVTLGLRNMRELQNSTESFDLDLPAGAVLLDTPVLDGKDLPLTWTRVKGKPNRFTVSIPEQERSQRIAVRFEMQLANDDASEKSPFKLVVPQVVGAVRQKGEIQIQTSSNYRLRWRSSPWVRSFFTPVASDSSSTRAYQFRFDRGDFSLPIWLSANKRQLHVTSSSVITIRDTLATLEMEILFKGRAADSRSLRVGLDEWRLRAVIDADTDDTLPWFESNKELSIEMNSTAEELPPIKIFAQRDFANADSSASLQFALPRILRDDDALSIGTSDVAFHSSGHSAFVVDLDRSQGLERAPAEPSDEESKILTSRFRVLATDSAAEVVGAMVDQPPQITLQANAKVTLSGDLLTTIVDWAVDPQVNLDGNLAIRVPLLTPSSPAKPVGSPSSATASTLSTIATSPAGLANLEVDSTDADFAGVAQASATEDSATEDVAANADASADQEASDPLPPVSTNWVVTVDNATAQLESLGGDRFRLVSDRLGIEPVVIRWRSQELIAQASLTNDVHNLWLPVPALPDVTVRGDVVVELQGDSATNLFATDRTSSTQLEFQTIPDRVRVRLAKQTTNQNDLSIRKAVLRTAVGASTRHEQLLALTQGGDTLDLRLPAGLGDLQYDAQVDGEPTQVSRDANRLRVSLPGDSDTHRLDLRIWVNEPRSGLMAKIEPVLQLPLRAGQIYWQVITPRDSHIVWASPSVGRAMDWQFRDWQLSRQSIFSDETLAQWVNAGDVAEMPPGNRYLYLGSDVRSFSTRTLSRATLWLSVGGFVLAIAWMLTYIPVTRSPLTAVVGAVFFAGLVALAPDAAVMAGQLTMIALVLVIVMVAISTLLGNPRSRRFRTTATPSPSRNTNRSVQSTQTYQAQTDSHSENETVSAAVSPHESAQ